MELSFILNTFKLIVRTMSEDLYKRFYEVDSKNGINTITANPRSEIDISGSALVLEAEINNQLCSPYTSAVVLDLRGAIFIDATGIRTLKHSNELAKEQQKHFIISLKEWSFIDRLIGQVELSDTLNIVYKPEP